MVVKSLFWSVRFLTPTVDYLLSQIRQSEIIIINKESAWPNISQLFNFSDKKKPFSENS